MGRYFNKSKLSSAECRRINNTRSYEEAIRQVRVDETLIGKFNDGLDDVSPFLYSEYEFKYWDEQYGSGQWLTRQFYAVKKAFAEANAQ
jgi:hypothetical protein